MLIKDKLLELIRSKYDMDELYDEGKPNSDYRNELKFRRGGKTLITLYFRDDYIVVNIIFGKAEREKFEAIQEEFSNEICEIYKNARTYHDGKWMFFDIRDDLLFDDIMRMLTEKLKHQLHIHGETQ